MSSLYYTVSYLFFSVVLAQWTELIKGTFNMPGHTYEIFLNVDEILEGTLSWTDNANLDIHIFREGSNILNIIEAFKSFDSEDLKKQNFTFRCQESSTYFVRVVAFDLIGVKYLRYTINLRKSNFERNYQGTFHRNSVTSPALIVSSLKQPSKIGFRYLTNSFSQKTAILSSPISYPNLNISQNQVACVSGMHLPTYLILVITTTSQSFYLLTSINYTLQYYIDYPDCPKNCPQKYQWTNNTKMCMYSPLLQEPYDSSLKTFIFISVVIPIVLFGIMLIIGFFLLKLFKKCKRQIIYNKIQRQHLIKKIDQRNQSSQFNDGCSICLRQNCDASLPCHHQFHEECIKQWLKTKNVCPLCRTQII